MVKRRPLLLLALMVAAAASAEDMNLDEYLEQFSGLLKDVLQINIRVRVLNTSEELVWEAKKQMYTVPGAEVEVRIPSENLVILAYFTPVKLKGDRLMLQVHAQVFSERPPSTGGASYTATINYIPAELGEKIRFYPLGEFPDLTDRSALDSSSYNLELEIQIVPYGSN